MISWSSEYETGVAFVDDDHKRLVEGLNELERALSAGVGSLQIAKLLAFLQSYSAGHFSREEACMARYECPHAQANKDAHREFSLKFERARTRLKTSAGAGALVALQVHRELFDWVVNHILRVDSGLRGCQPKHVLRSAMAR